RRARSSATGPHGSQSTGLCACCRRYGEVSAASAFATPRASLVRGRGAAASAPPHGRREGRASTGPVSRKPLTRAGHAPASQGHGPAPPGAAELRESLTVARLT